MADLDALAPGDHICWAVDADDDYELSAKRSLVGGTGVGDKVFYVGPQGSLAGSPLSGLAMKAFDPGAALQAPRGDDLLQLFRREAASAVSEGFRSLRVVADMDWVAGLATNDELTAFELHLDAACDELGAVVICAYRTTTFPAGEIARVNTVHPQEFGHPSDDLGFRVCASGPQRWDVIGEVDCFSADAFGFVLASAAASGTVSVRLDRLAFIDVAGMRAIAAAAESGPGIRMRLESPSETFARCWALLGYEALASNVELVR